jgi:hypothetical protein
MRLLEPSCPGEARSRFKENKYGLKKPKDFIMSKGHGYPLKVYTTITQINLHDMLETMLSITKSCE